MSHDTKPNNLVVMIMMNWSRFFFAWTKRMCLTELTELCPCPLWTERVLTKKKLLRSKEKKKKTFMLYWNEQLPTWTVQMPSGRMIYGQTLSYLGANTRLNFQIYKQQQLSTMVRLALCCGTSELYKWMKSKRRRTTSKFVHLTSNQKLNSWNL